jgi:hypothetical protein
MLQCYSRRAEDLFAQEVKRILGGGRVDFIFIDGDHTCEGVKRDFEMHSPLMRICEGDFRK